MRLIARNKSEQEISAVDPWTMVHFGSGLAMGLLDFRFETAAALNVGYEIVENVAQRAPVGQKFFGVSTPEHPVNALVDIVVVMGGWYLGRRWNGTLR